jgi:glucose/arabinose dehydrogenase
MQSALFRARDLLVAVMLLAFGACFCATEAAEINAGLNKPNTSRPFIVATIARFDSPWAIAFLPDGRMLITEKPGRVFLVTQQGAKRQVGNIPKVRNEGQNGLLDIAPSPHFVNDHIVYLTYNSPGAGGSALALTRARLVETSGGARLEDSRVIWKQSTDGLGGQPGGIITFSPDGQHLFLTVGDRMVPENVQNPDLGFGKILRLNLDGSTPKDNPMAAKGGVRGQTWTTGHRNPYGLAFAPDGILWEDEMGPMGGDELNIERPGLNYGWPVVSNGDNYDGTPIPRHRTHPEFEPPIVYWTPVIAPAGLTFYSGTLFPEWKGSAFIGALREQSLVRIAFDTPTTAHEADRWKMGEPIRDVVSGPDGALWLIEDGDDGRLLRLTPKK